MVTENVDIRFQESGTRVIKRKIDDLGQAADRATRGIFLLQRSIFALGGFGLVRGLTRMADALTNIENRLQLTSKSSANLETVQSELFRVARDSRAEFESVAEIYSRTALSVRDLGISQKETIRFTESLSKAAILSGASTREANAALIQLSQGLSSNRLSGDELRSVLEQLPFVADVIAKSLGITRGELRKFGSEGKISAEAVLKAFREAEAEIDQLFAKTVPTISQALSVARTNFLQFLDDFDDATGASEKLARGIIFLSENIENIGRGLLVVAGYFALTFGIKQITALSQLAAGYRALGVQQARFVEIEALRAAGATRRAAAQVAANAADANAASQNIILLQQNRARILAEQAQARAQVATIAASQTSAASAQRLAAARVFLNDRTKALIVTEQALRAQRTALATATTAQAGATATLNAATAQLNGAQAVQATLGARLAATFPTITGALITARNATLAFSAALLANPIGLVVTAIVAAGSALFFFGNMIKTTADGVVGLKDFVVAAFQIIADSISEGFSTSVDAVTGFISTFQSEFDFLKTYFSTLAEVLFRTFENIFLFLPKVVVGFVTGTVAAFSALPEGAALTVNSMIAFFVKGFENIANAGVKMVNSIISGVNTIVGALGGQKAAEFFGFSGIIPEVKAADFSGLITTTGAAGAAAGDAFTSGFSEGFNSVTFGSLAEGALGGVTQAVNDRARQNIDGRNRTDQANAITEARRQAELNQLGPTGPGVTDSGGGKKGGGSQQKDFSSIIAEFNKEIELLKLSNAERKIATGLLDIEKQLKRGLTEVEKELATETLKSLEAAKTQSEVLQGIIGPREEIKEQQIALNQLYVDGRIGVEDYTVALREMAAAAAAASNTFSGGFKSSVLGAVKSTADLGKAVGDVFVNSVGQAADAVVEFATTGKINIRAFFSDFFNQLLKLAANQLFLQLLGGGLGGGGGGGGIGGLLGGLFGFNTGGSIMPTGPGSTDSQVVTFKKRPDERVDVLTPGQQKAQADALASSSGGAGGGGAGSGGAVVNVAVVVSQADIQNAFKGSAGETIIIRGIANNAGQVKKVLG